jgi:transposase
MLTKAEKNLLTELLNLPGYQVVNKQVREEFGLILYVENSCRDASCPRCGRTSHKIHQNHYHIIKDLPWNKQDIFLRINRRQFKCRFCNKPFSEEIEFVAKRRGYTKRYAEEILMDVIKSDILSVSQRSNLSQYQIQNILKDVGKELIKNKPEGLKDLGIDEISWVKGQGNYCAVLVDLETHKPITLVEGRTQEILSKVFESWGIEVLEGIKRVSIDLWNGYRSLVERLMPNVEVIADRFHFMKQINQELDSERKKEIREIKEIKDKEKREEKLEGFKKSKYPLLKNEEDLNEDQKERLEKVKSVSPRLAVIHKLKEDFRNIFESSENWATGTLLLLDWMKSAEKYLTESCRTIVRWFGEITAYFEHRISNGIVEGINNKLKLIKRSAFGFRNFDNFKLRALLSWEIKTIFA